MKSRLQLQLPVKKYVSNHRHVVGYWSESDIIFCLQLHSAISVVVQIKQDNTTA